MKEKKLKNLRLQKRNVSLSILLENNGRFVGKRQKKIGQ